MRFKILGTDRGVASGLLTRRGLSGRKMYPYLLAGQETCLYPQDRRLEKEKGAI